MVAQLQHAEVGLIGPRLTALVGFLKGACGMTISALRRFFGDVLRVKVSKGFLAKLINKVSGSLADPYEELLKLLPDEERLNVDETGHKDASRRMWTWCFRAATFALFKISPSRGSDVLLEVVAVATELANDLHRADTYLTVKRLWRR